MSLALDQRVVVDASVAIKWLVAEEGSDRAEILLDRPLVVPDLLFAECANILWKKARRGELSGEEAATAAETLEQAELSVVSAQSYARAATAIAVELDHPAYDGLYLAIAEAAGLRLVTADTRLVRRVGGTRFARIVVSLADVELPS
jgi:predicted nucleic acid-binding protein